ncbi:alpha/beta fold hydrolase [Psychrobacillus vulpis]|uniref:Alpha/beta hydrolase n=1 Tax=Psychrobacillus vulpis TaxID=2325572 RepID=A0A544TWA9_9BACI|nr:alpha/beta hydrolase [Psychrobacillus vulpis]TQR21733.1 alpha/beta hydrolase [Psychrobacillus vulpis]
MEYRSIEINGGTLAYAEYEGSKGVIIGVHGLTGNSKQLHYYAELLKGDYRFISIDLRGRGNSSAATENTGIEQHTQDIIALIDALNIENPILMGYSMGGFIMAKVASKRDDVKGVIILDGAATCTDHQRQIVEPSLGRISKHYESAEAYLEEIKKIYSNLGVVWDDHMESVGRYEITEVDGHWENKSDEAKIRQDFQSFYDYKPAEVFANVECPVLLVHSTGVIGAMPALFLAESYNDTQQYAKNIHKITTDSNHYTLVFEKRSDVNPTIKDFVKKL